MRWLAIGDGKSRARRTAMPETICPTCDKTFWAKPFRLVKSLKNKRPACSIKCSQIATRTRINQFLISVPKLKCACGCGQLAPIYRRTYSKRKIFKGQPARFIFGHAFNKNLTVQE